MGNPVTLDCCIRSLVADLPEELPNPIIEWEANDVLAQPVRCSIARQSVEGAFKITEDGTIQIADSKRVSTRRLHQVTVMMQDIDGRFHRLRLAIHHQQ